MPDERGEDGDFVLRAGVAALAGAEELAVDDSAHFLLLSFWYRWITVSCPLVLVGYCCPCLWNGWISFFRCGDGL